MRNEKTQEAKNCDEDPCKQQRWKRQRQEDEEESDEEHHNPDTLERQLEEFTDEIENAPLITMGKEEGGKEKKEEKSKILNLITERASDHEADKDERDQDQLTNRTKIKKPTLLT